MSTNDFFFPWPEKKKMEPPLRRLRNEQFMPGGGAPPSIRELAEQSYAMRESDLRENSQRKQRDDTLYRRSMDPNITHTRKNTPDAGTMPKYTKEGIIKRNREDVDKLTKLNPFAKFRPWTLHQPDYGNRKGKRLVFSRLVF